MIEAQGIVTSIIAILSILALGTVIQQEPIRMGSKSNYIKFETGRNLPLILKIVTHTAQLSIGVGDCC